MTCSQTAMTQLCNLAYSLFIKLLSHCIKERAQTLKTNVIFLYVDIFLTLCCLLPRFRFLALESRLLSHKLTSEHVLYICFLGCKWLGHVLTKTLNTNGIQLDSYILENILLQNLRIDHKIMLFFFFLTSYHWTLFQIVSSHIYSDTESASHQN